VCGVCVYVCDLFALFGELDFVAVAFVCFFETRLCYVA
jgi:hypothetical protein